MAGFQIHTKDGVALSISTLDAEAANFWGKEVQPREYANPSAPRKEGESSIDYLRRSMIGNWFDIIGYRIAYPKDNYTSGWANVKNSMFLICMSGYADIPELEQIEGLKGVNMYLKPYFALIDHWNDKGYQPVKIED